MSSSKLLFLLLFSVCRQPQRFGRLKPRCMHRISVVVRCAVENLPEPDWQKLKFLGGWSCRPKRDLPNGFLWDNQRSGPRSKIMKKLITVELEMIKIKIGVVIFCWICFDDFPLVCWNPLLSFRFCKCCEAGSNPSFAVECWYLRANPIRRVRFKHLQCNKKHTR